MADDLAGFWAAIDAAPGDDLPVLILADALDERGDTLGTTIRLCVADGRRPGRFAAGGAFWVTTTDSPVAMQKVRHGRAWRYVPVRPQASWLCGVYYRFLGGDARRMDFVNHGTVWRYADAAGAYRDLCRAQGEMRRQMFDPATGRHAFQGLTLSRWRDEARRVIKVALAELPADADRKARVRALRAAYPFSQRSGHPYKMWLVEQRMALGPSPVLMSAGTAIPGGGCDWCGGRGCVSCAAERWRVEV